MTTAPTPAWEKLREAATMYVVKTHQETQRSKNAGDWHCTPNCVHAEMLREALAALEAEKEVESKTEVERVYLGKASAGGVTRHDHPIYCGCRVIPDTEWSDVYAERPVPPKAKPSDLPNLFRKEAERIDDGEGEFGYWIGSAHLREAATEIERLERELEAARRGK